MTYYNSYTGKKSWYLTEPDTIGQGDEVYIILPYIEDSIETDDWIVDMAVNRIHSRSLIEIPASALNSLGISADKPLKFYLYYDEHNAFRGKHIYFTKEEVKRLAMLVGFHKLSRDLFHVLGTTTHKSFAVSWDYTQVLDYDKSSEEFKRELKASWYYVDGGGGDTSLPPTVYWFNIPLYAYYTNNRRVITLNNTSTGLNTYTETAYIGVKSSQLELRLETIAERINGGSSQSVRLDLNIEIKGTSTITGEEYDELVTKILYIPVDQSYHVYEYTLPDPGPSWNLNATIQYVMIPLDYGTYEVSITDQRLIIAKSDLSGTNNNAPAMEKRFYYGMSDNSSWDFWFKGYNVDLNTDEALIYYGPSIISAKLEDLPDSVGFHFKYLVDGATSGDYLDIYVDGYLIHHIDGQALEDNNGWHQELYIPLSDFKSYLHQKTSKKATHS